MKVLVSGYFGFGNIGDEIIRVVIENYFKNIMSIHYFSQKHLQSQMKYKGTILV